MQVTAAYYIMIKSHSVSVLGFLVAFSFSISILSLLRFSASICLVFLTSSPDHMASSNIDLAEVGSRRLSLSYALLDSS